MSDEIAVSLWRVVSEDPVLTSLQTTAKLNSSKNRHVPQLTQINKIYVMQTENAISMLSVMKDDQQALRILGPSITYKNCMYQEKIWDF